MTNFKNPVTIFLDDQLYELLNKVSSQQKRDQSDIVIESLRRYLHLKLFEMLREESLPYSEKWLSDFKKRLKEIKAQKDHNLPDKEAH